MFCIFTSEIQYGMRMEKQKIIVVGASSGIGRALAGILVSAGHAVGVTGRRAELLEEVAATCPERVYVRVFDATDTAVCGAELDALAAAMGGVDAVVISAGGGDVNEQLDFALEQQMIRLNVLAFTCIADWAFTRFLAQGYGQLAAITSIAGIRGSRQSPGYSAVKAYQINYLQGLRQKARNVQPAIAVTDICPGFVATPGAKSPKRFWVAPVDKAARQIYQGLRRRSRVVYITRRWRIIAILYRWLPDWLHERL